ncbi:uncharacterized protein B0H64DRAFT_404799 [Chaetomium fimeti]|uniref:Uncharacterized protein n=1 Tax=Chaetomium fimeti TaxID=1854472 RepID=A0AAE0LPY9_9PEZI|nr:hypothetical protein B0H64DRAFT_404799 [Chaetomium fimeti]
MAEQLNESRSQGMEDLPAFSIPVVEVVSKTSNLRTQNNPGDPWQRGTLTERDNKRVAVSCVCKDIVHGLYEERVKSFAQENGEEDSDDDDGEEEEPEHCSLIVLHFRFDPVDLGRRIKKVQTTLEFSAMDGRDDAPVVDRISADGFYWIYPTSQKEIITSGASGKAGGKVFGAELGGELKRERVVEREVSHAGTVRGAIRTLGANQWKPNAATWTLMENTEDRSGAPISLRASILVKRKPAVDFQAHFSMEVTPDNLTQAQTWFKSRPKDDPVLYKVDKKPTNKLHHYVKETIDAEKKRKMVNNLGKLDFDGREFTDITFRTVWQDAEKKK